MEFIQSYLIIFLGDVNKEYSFGGGQLFTCWFMWTFVFIQTWWFIIYPEGPLLLLTNFRMGMVKWCAMHLIHLGCDLWIVGNCLKTFLLDSTLWGDPEEGCSDDDRLLTAWHEFKAWARQHKWQLFGCLRYRSKCFSLFWPTAVWTSQMMFILAMLSSLS